MTGPYNYRQLLIIDERIAQKAVSTEAIGSVVSVETTRLRAMVIFDGATVATPVKLAGHVWCEIGDRVALNKYGSEWCAMGVTNRVTGPITGGVSLASTGGNTVSATPADMPGTPAFTFSKRWSSTPILIGHWASAWMTNDGSGSTGQAIGSLKFAGATTTTYTVWSVSFDRNGARSYGGAARAIPDATYTSALAAGDYTVSLQWSRSIGTLNQTSAEDWSSGFALEGGL